MTVPLTHHEARIDGVVADPGSPPPSPPPARTRGLALAAWLPIPLLLAAVLVLRAIGPSTSYDSPLLLLCLNGVFSLLASLLVACLIARSFLVRGQAGLLLMGCGVLVWSLSALTAVAAGLLSQPLGRQYDNMVITIHNACVWLSAGLHCAGAMISLRYIHPLRRPGLWLAGGYMVSVALVATVVFAALLGATPLFFVPGAGGTPLRQAVLTSAIVMFAASAGIILRLPGRPTPAFVRWYACGLLLAATGLLGVMLQASQGSILGWTGRTAQLLGGLYLLLAALASIRETGTWAMPLETALSEARRRYSDLMELAGDGIVVHELVGPARGCFEEANPAICRLLGYTAAEMRTLTPLDILAPECLNEVPQDRYSMARDGTLRHEKTLLARDGRRIPVEISTRQFDWQGRTMVISILRDIRERRAAERALRESEQKLRAALEAAGMGNWVYTFGSQRWELDERAQALYGLDGPLATHDDTLMKRIMHPDDLAPMWRRVEEAAAGDGRYYMEYRILRPGGGWRWLDAWAQVEYAGQGPDRRPVRMVGASRDVTEAKRSQEELARRKTELEQVNQDLSRSNRDLEQFAYVASHDLLEPLRMVTVFLGRFQDCYGAGLEGRALEYIGFAAEGGRRMTQLVNDLLDYSRVQRHDKPLERADLGQAAGEAVANCRAAIEETQARVEVADLPSVRGDRGQLVQLLQNLLANALKFRREGTTPRIRIDALPQNGTWIVRVADNGIGLASEHSERIFQIFQRLHTRKEYPGTGIGLAICKKIVERHGGRIWVESEPGRGATFCFSLPAVSE